MKHKSILSFFIFLFGLGATTTSCEDMLTPDMDRYNEGFSGTDTVNFYLGIVRNVQDMVEQNELLGDLRSDLVATTPYSSDTIADIINYKRQIDGDNALLNRAAYYKVINQCNFYLAKVDTNAVKNDIYFMRREYAQVVAIRAWTYLQLVQTYGKVPFITKPVDNANTGWEKNPEAWADANNLVDLLKDEMQKANVFEHTLGGPQYGDYMTGNPSFNVPSGKVRFYNDLVLGDLYLLKGSSKEDYMNAAKHYYYFLKEYAKNGKNVTNGSQASMTEVSNGGSEQKTYLPQINSWIGSGLAAAALSNENITIIPSAANSSFGRVLANSVRTYGFDPHSTNSTETSGENTTTKGQITVRTNYKSRQVEPSAAYLSLCANQVYSHPEFGGNSDKEVVDVKYYKCGDARLHATAPIFTLVDDPKSRFVTKYSPVNTVREGGETTGNPSYKYYKSIYRLKQVYLRYAEAINRAGYPRMAYAILRDGLNYDKMPVLADSVHYDDDAKTAQTVFYLDSARVFNATNYIGVDELRRAQAEPEFALCLDFTKSMWKNDGIHEQGCGLSSEMDSLSSYEVVVGQRILDEAKRANALTPEVQSSVRSLLAGTRAGAEGEGGEGGDNGETVEPDRSNYTEIDPVAPAEANPLEINAVETLIADECALEMAFEGTRMFDLIRFARHKDADANFGANYGTNWLAWKVARRAKTLAPYQDPADYDAALYGILLSPEQWYIANPEY